MKKAIVIGLGMFVLFMASQSVFAYIYSGYKWASPSTTWSFDSSFPTAYYNAVKNADNTWDKAGSKFRFNYGSSLNKVYWGALSDPLTRAQATMYLSGSNIVSAKVVFNNGVLTGWTTDCNYALLGMSDVESIGLHEFGHWLWLKDEYDPAHLLHVMYFDALVGCRRGLDTDDKNGIKYIYGV